MGFLKHISLVLVCLAPILSAVGLVVWRTFSDPGVERVLNYVFYGFVVVLSVIVSVFVLVFIINCTNRAFQIMFGKPAFNVQKKTSEN